MIQRIFRAILACAALAALCSAASAQVIENPGPGGGPAVEQPAPEGRGPVGSISIDIPIGVVSPTTTLSGLLERYLAPTMLEMWRDSALRDMAVLTGGKVRTEELGEKLDVPDASVLKGGKVSRDKDGTTIVDDGDDGGDDDGDGGGDDASGGRRRTPVKQAGGTGTGSLPERFQLKELRLEEA